MATLITPIYTVERVETHPNADRLDLAYVAGTGYRCCVGKGSVKAGDKVAYIQDGALVPEDLLKAMGLEGKLSGPKHNRVKPWLLRGILSEGLMVPIDKTNLKANEVEIGQDVSTELGITKYEPESPEEMLGRLIPAHSECLDFEVEDTKRFPGVIQQGEEVVVSEKIHGIMTCLGYGPKSGPIVTGKGLGTKGLKFDTEAEENRRNIYVRMWKQHEKNVRTMQFELAGAHGQIYVLGEIAGPGVQKLHYGRKTPALFVFDIFIGDRRTGHWLSPHQVEETCKWHDLECAQTIYAGPYLKENQAGWSRGQSLVSGANHAREGAVVRLVLERKDAQLGRVIVKHVSEKYLAKSTGEEPN